MKTVLVALFFFFNWGSTPFEKKLFWHHYGKVTFDDSLMKRSNGSRVVIKTFMFLSSLMIKFPLRLTKSIYTSENHRTLSGDSRPYSFLEIVPDNMAVNDVDSVTCLALDVHDWSVGLWECTANRSIINFRLSRKFCVKSNVILLLLIKSISYCLHVLCLYI